MLVYVDEYNLILFYILCAYRNQRKVAGGAGQAAGTIQSFTAPLHTTVPLHKWLFLDNHGAQTIQTWYIY